MAQVDWIKNKQDPTICCLEETLQKEETGILK